MGTLPEDENVPISIAEHIPCVVLNRRSRFSRAIMQLAEKYATGLEPEQKSSGGSFMEWLRSLFGR